MSAPLIVEYSHIQVELRHLDRMGGWTVKVKALVVFLAVTFVRVHHMLHPILGLQVDSVPAGWELDVDLQL